MKTWQMIKELTENPNKRFRSLTDSSRREERKIAKSDGKVLIHINDGSRLAVYLNEEWEEVKQPVSFMEAVGSGKRVQLVYEPFGNQIYRDLGDLLFNLSKECKTDIARDIIINGKFHIED